jgi:hypothetical protein
VLECGRQRLLDIGPEHFTVHRSVEHEGRDHSIVTQAGDNAHRLSVAVRYAADQPLATPTASAQLHHLGRDRGFVEEHQPGRLELALLAAPAPTRPRNVGPLLLGGTQAFFWVFRESSG